MAAELLFTVLQGWMNTDWKIQTENIEPLLDISEHVQLLKN
jgi:hypothetical protein